MSVNLMIITGNDVHEANWAALTAIAKDATVHTDDHTVRLVAELLKGVRLANGETVSAYPMDEDECMASAVFSFGPNLLPPAKLEALKLLVAQIEGGTALLDVVIERNLQISLNGKEAWHGAYMRATNNDADEVDVNRSSSNMQQMFVDLGLAAFVPARGEQSISKDVPFPDFVRAVNDNARMCESHMAPRLRAFVEMGRRRGATAVYYA